MFMSVSRSTEVKFSGEFNKYVYVKSIYSILSNRPYLKW